MKTYTQFIAIATMAFLLFGCSNDAKKEVEPQRPNVLFIAIDDLRPELGIYGNKVIHTPRIDQLGKDGAIFNRAYVQLSACNPSRVSLMTGLRPDATKVWDLWTKFRDSIPDVVTLPQYFKNNGYHSVGIGKLYHNTFPDSLSWSEPKIYLKQFPFDPDAFYVTSDNLKIQNQKIKQIIATGDGERKKDLFGHYYVKASATEIADVPDTAYYDGAQTITALSKLEELAGLDKPFFFGVGYYRPHLPFNAPKKYWELYNRDSISLATNTFIPKNVPSFSVSALREIKGYVDFRNTPPPAEAAMSQDKARLLKHGYYASVSYIDVQVGLLIDKLKELDLYDNTIIVVWGDHGYKLGEHNGWTKFSNFKIDNQAPLIIKSTVAKHQGVVIDNLVEFVDIYPTLCELAGLEIPSNLQGMSAVSLLNGKVDNGKKAIFFQYLKERRWDAMPEGKEQMGYSILTDDYHYIDWYEWNTGDYTINELYDLRLDPDENENVANQIRYDSVVNDLGIRLKEGWKAERENALARGI